MNAIHDSTRAQTIIEEIYQISDLDALERIQTVLNASVKAARTKQAARTKASLSPGDRVRITGSISPKYLIGCEGTVASRQARRGGDVQVQMDKDFLARRFSGAEVGVPASCLEKIEATR
jgi:hypothetical protein